MFSKILELIYYRVHDEPTRGSERRRQDEAAKDREEDAQKKYTAPPAPAYHRFFLSADFHVDLRTFFF